MWTEIKYSEIEQLPSSGHICYMLKVEGDIVYIGRTKKLWWRIRHHEKLELLDTDKLTIAYSKEEYDNEAQLIQKHRPIHNIDQICKHESQRSGQATSARKSKPNGSWGKPQRCKLSRITRLSR